MADLVNLNLRRDNLNLNLEQRNPFDRMTNEEAQTRAILRPPQAINHAAPLRERLIQHIDRSAGAYEIAKCLAAISLLFAVVSISLFVVKQKVVGGLFDGAGGIALLGSLYKWREGNKYK